MIDAGRNSPSKSSVQICTLRYCRPGSPVESTDGPVILLAVKDRADLRLYAHRTLRQQISDRDQEYIDDLLKDLIRRSKTTPDEVFQQLSNLSVGPIVTDVVGLVERRKFNVGEQYPDFIYLPVDVS